MRSHRVAIIVGVAGASAVLGSLVGAASVALPALSGSMPFAKTPFAGLFALLPTVAVAFGIQAGSRNVALASVRSLPWRELLLCLAGAGIGVLISGAVAAALPGLPGPLGYARCVIGYTGVHLIARAALRSSAQALPAALYFVLAALFGRGDGDAAAPWAWPVSLDPDPGYWGIPLALLLVGAACMAWRALSADPAPLLAEVEVDR